MFILMYWGVLVQRATRDPSLWALVSEGRDVVAEASEFLLRSEIADIPGVREGIAWTRNDAGLPPLPACPLPAALHGSRVDVTVSEDFLESWKSELGLLLQPEERAPPSQYYSEPRRSSLAPQGELRCIYCILGVYILYIYTFYTPTQSKQTTTLLLVTTISDAGPASRQSWRSAPVISAITASQV